LSQARRTTIVAASFALSGAAALVYQVVWQRLLALQTGVGIVSITAITAAFMVGLGLGNHWGGLLSRRLDSIRALRLFAAVEGVLGIFGACSVALYYDVLYRHGTALYASPALGLSLHFAALLPPTVLMGMSLPLLVSGTVSAGTRADRTVDLLYALNTLGAAAGAFATPVLILRHTSLRGAVVLAGMANMLAALGALAAGSAIASGRRQEAPREEASRYPRRQWLWFYGLGGFVSLGLELVWFRLTAVGVKATAFTFGAVLFVYLLGLGAGGLVGRNLGFVSRAPLRAFLLAQSSIAIFAALPVVAIPYVRRDWPVLGWFVQYWGQRFHLLREGPWDTVAFLRLYGLWPALLFLVPTLLMGIAFCALQKAVANEGGTSGLKVGALQAANIAGCVAGSLGVGLYLMDRFGATGSLRVLLACSLVFAIAGAVKDRVLLFVPVASALALLVALVPSQETLWRALHARAGQRFMVKEDRTGVIALSLEEGRQWYVWIDGQSLSWLPFGGIHTLLGAIPSLVHPAPHSIAVVGLGSGNTAWAAGCRRDVERVTIFEIMRPQGELLRRLDAQKSHAHPPRLTPFLADPRMAFRWADGRHALTQEDTRYDIIEADALLPETAGSGSLYSLEFFRLTSQRLAPGGLMCTWAPTAHVAAAFYRVFPHVIQFPDNVLVGSLSPLPLDVKTWLARVAETDVRDYLGSRNSAATLAALEGARLGVPPRPDVAPNRDLAPWDEFARRQ
jgi:spermidine synthase